MAVEASPGVPDSALGEVTPLVHERAKLRKVLRRFDLILFSACALVGLDSVAYAASIGGQVIVWLVVSLVLFLVPYGMIIAELGSAFPVEGGPYAWVRASFGRLAGSITATLYWLSNPIWLGGTLTATTIAALNSFVFKKPLGTGVEIAVGLVFVWVAVGLAITALRWGKWAPNLGTIVKAGVVAIFTALFIAFLVDKGRPAGTVGLHDLKPTLDGFLFSATILMFLWVGFEVANGASEEMRRPQRDVPVMVGGGGLIGAALYGLAILGILLVIPKATLSSVSGFTAAYQSVAGILGGASRGFGYLFAALIIITLLASGAVWLEGADRTQAITALDGGAPGWMGYFASFGTPLAVNLMSGIIGSVFVVLVFTLAKGSLSSFFSVMLSLTISTTALSYFFIFPSLLVLRRKYPDQLRPYRVPGGALGAWVAVVLTEAFVVITAMTLLWPGLIDRIFGRSYSITSSWGVSRAYFEEVTLGSLGVFVLVGVVFWLLGRRNIRRGLVRDRDLFTPVVAQLEPGTGPGSAPTDERAA
jgi:amino acid transporter